MDRLDLLKKLASYVPMPIAQAIYQDPRPLTKPLYRRVPAAVLFADISGFTLLSEKLSKAGPTGAEELTQMINAYFTRMIAIVQTYQGQVVKFSGDAMTVLFPTEHISMQVAVRRAAECALTMQAEMSHFADIRTLQDEAAPLSMKVGIGAGTVLECSVGGVMNRWEYVVAGDPLVQVAMAENHAKPGQIVLSKTALDHVSSYVDCSDPLTDAKGCVTLYKVRDPLPHAESPALAWEALSPDDQAKAEKALQGFVPGAIKARIHEQADWLAELRRMTVLFIGIGGFDYEANDAGEQLQKFLQANQELTYRFEGSLGKVVVDDKGTVLVTLFGAPPFSHEDDAARAVAYALKLQGVARKQNLRMSIGITEGAIFAGPVGAPNRREYTVIGDQVNLAARLMQYGRAGTIIVSERVKERAGPAFMIEDLGHISIKGRNDGLSAYLVKGEQDKQDEFVTRYLLLEDPLVGRKAELEQLRRIAARAKQDNMQLLLIEGELGLGKTRLSAELVREWMMEGDVGYGSKCVSYSQQTPYQGWREILTAIFGLTPSLTPERRLARLATGIADLEDPPDQPSYWADRLPLLADVIGLDAPQNDFTRNISGELRRDNTFALIEAILRRQSERRPLLLVLDDVQWADELTLSLAAHLAQKLIACPVLLVLIYRPVSEKQMQPIADVQFLPYTHTIHLEPLTTQESLNVIDILLDGHTISAEARETLVNRGQGNPFFLQEIIGAILDLADKETEDQTSRLFDTLDLPNTVQDVVLSRIDRLSEEEKLTLKIASVIGTNFQRSLLSAVHPMSNGDSSSLSRQLRKLEAAKLIRLETPAPKWEYAFHNVITQEVIYEGLLLSQRRQLHGTVGAALESLTPDEVEQLAFHYNRSDNETKALRYLQVASQKAHREYANQAAIRYYSEILTWLAHHRDEQGRQQGRISAEYWEVLMNRAKLYNLTGQREQEEEDLGELGIIAEAMDDDERRALAAKQWAYRYETNGDYESALELIERATRLAQMAGNEQLVGECYNQWGRLLYPRGEYEVAHHYLQNALIIAQQHHDKSAQADSLNSLGIVARYQLDYEVALYFFREAQELWESMGDQVGLGATLSSMGGVYYDMGDYVEAKRCYDRSLSLHRTIGERAGEAIARQNLGQVYRTWGDYETARAMLEEALVTHQSTGDFHNETHTLYHLGFLYARLGNEQGYTFLEEAILNARELNDRWSLRRALTYLGWSLIERGDLDEAYELVVEALQIARDTHQDAASMENFAHMGEIALLRDDLNTAEAYIRHVRNFVAHNSIQGLEHAVRVYLISYRVLEACGKHDEGLDMLQQGHEYIEAQAAQIEDSDLREKYLTNIPENRELFNLLEATNERFWK